jgi:cell division protease FtsH
LADVARLTVGFTGADLENLMNEAAILAARNGNLAVDSSDLNAAFERIVAGPERSKKLLSPQERRVVAFHEAGHAIVMECMPLTDPVHKISIISRGLALGYTMALPERDKVLRSKEAIEEEIAGLLGGRVAEELLCGSVTTGAANDLERASACCRSGRSRLATTAERLCRGYRSQDRC